jgi:ABC-type transporter Mla maintaining outer membrane lipid asymmetry ATPase subunit MlaF
MVDVQKNVESVSLAWQHLTFQVNGKTILSDVSGCLASGQMLAVMGPSGASVPNYNLLFSSSS